MSELICCFNRLLNSSSSVSDRSLNCTAAENLVKAFRPSFQIKEGGPGLPVGSRPDQKGEKFSYTFAALGNKAPGSSGLISIYAGKTVLPAINDFTQEAELFFEVFR